MICIWWASDQYLQSSIGVDLRSGKYIYVRQIAVPLSSHTTAPTRTPTPTRTFSPISARGSSRGCRRVQRLPCSACHSNNFVLHERNNNENPRVLYMISYHVHKRLQNYTIGASLMSLSVSVSVSVPWNCSFMYCYYLLGGDTAASSGLCARLCHACLVFSPLG